MYFEIQTDHLISARRLDLVNVNKKKKRKKKRTYRIEDFAVSADFWVKLKEDEKKDKYQNVPRELKKLWNMKVTEISILIGVPGTVTKGLDKRT